MCEQFPGQVLLKSQGYHTVISEISDKETSVMRKSKRSTVVAMIHPKSGTRGIIFGLIAMLLILDEAQANWW